MMKTWAITVTCSREQRADLGDRSQFIMACMKLHDIYAGKQFCFTAEYHVDGTLHFHGQVPRVGQLLYKVRRAFGHVKAKRVFSLGWGVYCAKELYETERKLCYKPTFSNLTRDSDMDNYFYKYMCLNNPPIRLEKTNNSPSGETRNGRGVKISNPDTINNGAVPFGEPVPLITSFESKQEGYENHFTNYKMKD